METKVTPLGRLKNEFLPAVYFDSSVLIDYWMAEGMEIRDEGTEGQQDRAEVTHDLDKVVAELLRSDIRLNKVVEIRNKAIFEDIKTTPVATHAALWELQEWFAESGFKQVASEVSRVTFVQRKSKKEIGDYLKKGFELWKLEPDEKHHYPYTSGLESLMQATWVNPSFATCHGLQGILVAPTVNFNWPPKKGGRDNSFVDPYMLAFLQLGLADIMHVILASHLGCRYFASFDFDFRRAKEFIEETGMSVLTSPEEVLSIL